VRNRSTSVCAVLATLRTLLRAARAIFLGSTPTR
jgi:hypothetical protein